VTGRRDIMRHFDRGEVADEALPHIGTLSGNPVASVSGLATLEVLREPGVYEKTFATGRKLMDTLSGLLRQAGLPAQVIGEPVLFDVMFVEGEVADYRDTLRQDMDALRRFNRVLRENGVMKGDTKFYVSIAHDEADVAKTIAAFEAAVAAEVAFRRG
jgi:glutamate-1-semialdehyde 2,1-aminomutase